MEKSTSHRLNSVKQFENQQSLVSFKDIPVHMTWLTDNPYLLHSYRQPTTSFLACVTSNFSCLHTESLNIITHLIPTLLALYTLVHLLLYKQPLSFFSQNIVWENTPTMDRLVLCLVSAGMIYTFGLSTLFHVFSCHKVYGGHFLTLDLMGIILLGYIMIQATGYFLLYSYPFLLILSVISNFFATWISLILINLEPFSRCDQKGYKGVLFLTYGFIILSPPLIAVMLGFGTRIDSLTVHLLWISISLAILIAPLVSAKFPESYLPGLCDIWGHSHSIWHLTSAAVVFFFYHAILRIAEAAIREL